MIRGKTKPQNPRRYKGRNKTMIVGNTKRGRGRGRKEKKRKEKKAGTLRTGFQIWHFY
jgi:hypothetical protein